MHNLTKIIREYDQESINLAQNFINENKISIISKNGRGIKASVEDKDEKFIVFLEFADDLSIATTTCSCDNPYHKCIHTCAVLLYVKQNFLRSINKYKRENMKNQLLFLDYFRARDFLVKGISNQTIKKHQVKAVLLDNRKFTKEQRAALFSLCFANYLHEGRDKSTFRNLMKTAFEIMDEYLTQNVYTVQELEQIIYDAATLFDENDYKEFLAINIKVQPYSLIFQRVLSRLPHAKESACSLIKDNEKGIIKGDVPMAFETLVSALQYYNYKEYISFKVYKAGIKQAIQRQSIRDFTVLLFLGFIKFQEIDQIIDDETSLFMHDYHEKILARLIKMITRLDLDQLNPFLVFLVYKIGSEDEKAILKEIVLNKISTGKSINVPLLYFAVDEPTKYEIIVTNSNYRQVCQMIEFAKDEQKRYLTNLIVKRLENNFIDCNHEFETNYEIELLLKNHQDYIQLFLENNLRQNVNKKRRLFYLNLARKYNLLTKVGLHIFEDK